MTHHSRSLSRRLIGAIAGLALCTSALAAAVSPANASKGHDHPEGPETSNLGPTVVKTNKGPTGYAVTFRYDAPDDVTSVQVYGEWTFSQPASVTCQGCGDARSGAAWKQGDIPAGPWTTTQMVQGSDGIWTLTVPLPSGTFSYSYLHDCTSSTGTGCTRYLDPANAGWTATFPTGSRQTLSQVYVPNSHRFSTYDNDYQAPLDAKQLGRLEHREYTSPASLDPAGTHNVSVYLPKGYNPHRRTPYPTLYLSHGGGGMDTDWFTQGVAPHIVQRAINSGDAEPMVIVATNYNGFGSGNTSPAVLGFVNDVKTNVIPFVESNYNVSTKASNRAFAGLSAGGLRTLNIVFNTPELFEYYGLWSAGGNSPIPNAEQLEKFATIDGTVHNGVGLQDWQNNIFPLSIQRADAIRTSGVELMEHNVNGIHSWDVWRQELLDFVTNVAFKKSSTSLDARTVHGRTTLIARVDGLSDHLASASGRVSFATDDGRALGTARLSPDGTATLTLAPAQRTADLTVTASYGGDDTYRPSTSSAVTVRVGSAQH